MNRLPQGLSTIFGMLPQRTEQRVVERRKKKTQKKFALPQHCIITFIFCCVSFGMGFLQHMMALCLLLCFFLPFFFTIFHASIVRRSSDSKLPRLLVVFLFPFQNVTLTR